MKPQTYPSDLTDEQWALIGSLIPVHPGGRPRKTDPRQVVNAIFSILRTGCQWRYLPKDFSPKSTVWRYFNEWRHDSTQEKIHDWLRRKVRAAEKPYHPRTSASVDSQSVDTASGGECRGRDNAKNVDGRKRHLVVDSMGLPLAVLVTAADVDDAKAAPLLFARLVGQPVSKVVRNVRRREVPQPGSLGVGQDQREVGDEDHQTPRRIEGLGQATDPLDGGADVRLVGQVPSLEQGLGEDGFVVGGVREVGDDPVDAQPARTENDGRRVPVPENRMTYLTGQILMLNAIRDYFPLITNLSLCACNDGRFAALRSRNTFRAFSPAVHR